MSSKPVTAIVSAAAAAPGGNRPAAILEDEKATPPKKKAASAKKGVTTAQAESVSNRLWGLYSPLAYDAYTETWAGLAADIQRRLIAALLGGRPTEYKAAERASLLPFAACFAALSSGAPAVYRIVAEIRGLALSAQPELVSERKAEVAKRAAAAPGIPLVYARAVFQPWPPLSVTGAAPGGGAAAAENSAMAGPGIPVCAQK
jgi:hypothetical protein